MKDSASSCCGLLKVWIAKLKHSHSHKAYAVQTNKLSKLPTSASNIEHLFSFLLLVKPYNRTSWVLFRASDTRTRIAPFVCVESGLKVDRTAQSMVCLLNSMFLYRCTLFWKEWNGLISCITPAALVIKKKYKKNSVSRTNKKSWKAESLWGHSSATYWKCLSNFYIF